MALSDFTAAYEKELAAVTAKRHPAAGARRAPRFFLVWPQHFDAEAFERACNAVGVNPDQFDDAAAKWTAEEQAANAKAVDAHIEKARAAMKADKQAAEDRAQTMRNEQARKKKR